MEFHRKYNLRSKNNLDNLNCNNSDNLANKSSDIETNETTNNSIKKTIDNFVKNKVETHVKNIVDNVSKTTQTHIPTSTQQKEPITKQIIDQYDLPNLIKIQTSFNIENELAKLIIPIPLIELMNKNMYIPQVMKALNIGENKNSVNLNDD